MNIQKAKITNEIIPPLLSLFKDYNYNLKTRLKANSIFLSFDEKSKKTFNKFVILSNERFKMMKYGGNLNQILSKQKNNYMKINKDINNDILFTTNYPGNERKKLIKSVNILKSKQISSMREKLYETLRYKSPYDKKIKKRKLKIEDTSILNKKGRNTKKERSKTYNNHKSDNSEDTKEKLELIQSSTKDVIRVDQENFTKGLEKYKDFLESKKNELNDKENNDAIKIYKNDFSDIESHIKENNFKILTYKTKSSDNKRKHKNEDTTFDINILYKIKNFNLNHRKSILPKLKLTETETEELISDENLFRKQARKSIYNVPYNTFNNIDMRNTIDIINNEARNGVELDEKFRKQKNKVNRHYNMHLGTNKFNNFEGNKSSSLKASEKNVDNFVDNNIIKKSKISEHEKLLEDFQKIYEEKKMLWEKEDEKKEKMRKEKKKEQEEIINFLFSSERTRNKKNISKYN